MDFREVVRRIETAGEDQSLPANSDLRFQRFSEAWSELRLSYPDSGVILVAGTNGKGTVAKTLETLLISSGAATGLFTSPHLIQTTERIRSGGCDLRPAEFVAAYERIQPIVEKWRLSHFEVLTLMMCEVFFGGTIRPRVERAVIEVGLGGRLDPTRVIPHDTSVVTNLGLDHTEILGPNLYSIAKEKFGIVSAGNLVVHAPLAREAAKAADEHRLAVPQSRWVEAPTFPFRVEDGFDPTWIIETPWGDARLAAPGARTVQNVSIALATLAAQGRQDVARLLPAVSQAHWPCRMEKFILQDRRVYLSGDHNLQGVESLEEIFSHFNYDRLLIVVGIGASKDHAAMLESLAQLPRAELYLTQTPYRGAILDSYGVWLKHASGTFTEPLAALQMAIQQSQVRDLILVTGSLYLAGALRKVINNL